MNRTVIAAVMLAVTCLTSSPVFAHDQSLHKGKATEGEIISVEPNRFVMKTADGEKKVTLGQKTKIEVGDSPGNREDLKGGAHVAVFGTKLPGGEIVAKEIVVQGGDTHGQKGGVSEGETSPHEAHE